MDKLEDCLDKLSELDQSLAAAILGRRDALIAAVERLSRDGKGATLHRVHGDLHLGQVLVHSGDAVFIDFEGEPAQPLAERRAKDSGWRDVAGILRSLDYVLAARLSGGVASREAYDALAEAFRDEVPRALLAAYRTAAGAATEGPEAERDAALLQLFLIEKAAYEVLYELGNRPDWLSVPLGGLSRLLHGLPGAERTS